MASMTVQNFIDEFVIEEKRDAALICMQDLFAGLHMEMAKDFISKYKKPVVEEEEEEPKPKKSKPAPKKKNEEKKKCSGVTAKGEPCKNKCVDDEDLCRVHLKKKNEPEKAKKEPKSKKEPKAKKEPKKPKKTPVHNHDILDEEVDETCDVCNTHGNVAIEESTGSNGQEEEEYEAVDETGVNLQMQLANMLEEEEENEEEAFEEEDEFGEASDYGDEN